MKNKEELDTQNTPTTDTEKRKTIKKLIVGVGVVAGYSALPEKWIKPVVGQMILPAHAETSGELAETIEIETTVISTEESTFNSSETFSMKSSSSTGGKQYSWLTHTGSYYGGAVKFVFGNGCGELSVPDASVTYGADGNSSNHNQAFYFCGTDYSPGEDEYNNGLASVFAPPNCDAKTCTIYFNK